MSKEEIEKKARIIISLLLQKGWVTLSYLCVKTKEDSTVMLLTLGHLVGKGKITVEKKGDDLIINTTYSFSNMYY